MAEVPPGDQLKTCASYNVDGVTYNEFMDGTRVKVSRNGQVSVPAAVRHRWGTSTVLIIDRGDYAIVRPVPDDPIGALRGAYATPGPAVDAVRTSDRAAEAASDDRRRGAAG
jgi:AbrB family looped-hinge helix DNA binding protein